MTNSEYALLNKADYTDKNVVKKLYRQQQALHDMAAAGNQVAVCIYLDLREAADTCLTPKQRLYTDLVLIEGWKVYEVAEEYDISSTTVSVLVKKSMDKISKYLAANGDDLCE